MSAPATTAAPAQTKLDRRSGYVLVLLMLAAFGVAFMQIYQIASGPPPPRPGAQAPIFTAHTPEGGSLGLHDKPGQVVLVDFWATWCPPCRAAMPTLQSLQEEYGPRGFTVLGVNVEPGYEATVQHFMKQNGLTFPTVVDEGNIARTWGVYSYPTSFLVGTDGTIKAMYRGPASPGRLRQDIEAALPPAT
jgi:thiol-disulfide isomerase/thioredoxin